MFGTGEFFTELVKRFSVPGSGTHVHVLLHSTNGIDAQEAGAEQCEEPFEINARLWICRLPNELRDAVYKACEPPGEPYESAFRQYGQLYTISMFLGSNTPGTITSWDGYGLVTKVVAFSQLIHPTSIGFASTAVLRFDDDGSFRQATPGPCRGITEHAFVIPGMRNWLSKSECERIKDLYSSTDFGSLPERVARAHWNVQHAAFQFFFEVRTMLVAAGLDALVHVRNEAKGIGTGQQFTERTVTLAKDLGVQFTTDDAKALWEHRSDVAHGRDPWQSIRDPNDPKWQVPELRRNDPMVRRYHAGEEILRRTVLKCLTDQQFADRFASDDAVKKSYPIVFHARPKGNKHKP